MPLTDCPMHRLALCRLLRLQPLDRVEDALLSRNTRLRRRGFDAAAAIEAREVAVTEREKNLDGREAALSRRETNVTEREAKLAQLRAQLEAQ